MNKDPNSQPQGPHQKATESLQQIELLINSFLNFGGSYVKTLFHYLCTNPKNIGKGNSVLTLQPLSYLTTSLLIFVLSYLRVFKHLLEKEWISSDLKLVAAKIVEYHDSIESSTFALKLADSIIQIAPLVLVIAIFAKISHLISKFLRSQTHLESHLSATSYFFGTIAALVSLWSLPINFSITSSTTHSTASEFAGYLIIFIAIVLLVLSLFRFAQTIRQQIHNNWKNTILSFFLASTIQILLSYTLFKIFVITNQTQ